MYVDSIIFRFFCLLFLTFPLNSIARYPANESRIQYTTHKWMQYEIRPSITLFVPVGYEALAQFVEHHTDSIKHKISKRYSLEMADPLNIFIYPSPQRLTESNIGIHENSMWNYSIISNTNNRVAVGFDGAYDRLLDDILKALINLALKKRIPSFTPGPVYGSGHDAAWLFEGMASSMVDGWQIKEEAGLQEIFNAKPDVDWNELRESPYLLSKSFIYFLQQQYRPDAVMQLVYRMSSGKNLARSLRLVCYQSLDEIKEAYLLFYKQRFAAEAAALSNDAAIHAESLPQRATWTKEWNKKQHTIDIKINTGQKKKTLAKFAIPPGLAPQTDINTLYPLVYQNKVSKEISIINYEKGKLTFKRFSGMGTIIEKRELKGIDGVTDFKPGKGGQLWMSAFKNGRSDLVRYIPRSGRWIPLTDDVANQSSLVLNEEETTIYYRSGLPQMRLGRDTLSVAYGLYAKSLTAAESDPVLIAGDSAYTKWTPVDISDGRLVILHTAAGVYSTDSIAIPNIEQAIPHLIERSRLSAGSWKRDAEARWRYQDSIDALIRHSTSEYTNEFGNIIGSSAPARGAQQPVSRAPKPYLLRLYKTYFSGGINNEYFINRYQPFNAYSGTYKIPELGGLITGGMTDILEDHHFVLGYKLPVSISGSDFFVKYKNLKRRLDWELMYFRKSEPVSGNKDAQWLDDRGLPYPVQTKVITDHYGVRLTYPLNYTWALNADIAMRNDKTIFLSVDNYSLDYPHRKGWWSINQLKVQGRRVRTFKPLIRQGWETNAALDFMAAKDKNSSIFTLGLHAHYMAYLKTWKSILIQPRIQMGWSGGDQKILYLFGGVEGNVAPLTDTSRYFGQAAPYSFQTLITPFRGYAQNSIFGYAYGMVNLDIYVPLFEELIAWKPRIAALADLQIGIFCDYVKTRQDRSPAMPSAPASLYAPGFSARTTLAGLPVRFDYSLPLNGTKGIWYLSVASTF